MIRPAIGADLLGEISLVRAGVASAVVGLCAAPFWVVLAAWDQDSGAWLGSMLWGILLLVAVSWLVALVASFGVPASLQAPRRDIASTWKAHFAAGLLLIAAMAVLGSVVNGIPLLLRIALPITYWALGAAGSLSYGCGASLPRLLAAGGLAAAGLLGLAALAGPYRLLAWLASPLAVADLLGAAWRVEASAGVAGAIVWVAIAWAARRSRTTRR